MENRKIRLGDRFAVTQQSQSGELERKIIIPDAYTLDGRNVKRVVDEKGSDITSEIAGSYDITQSCYFT